MSGILIRIVEFVAHLNISQILIGRVPLTLPILYYGIIVFAGFVVLRRSFIKRIMTITAILILVIYLGTLKWQRSCREDLVLTCLDVGHGQAILARLPGKTNVLFDAGSLHRRDVGARIIVPYLEHMGINKIDAVIISHNDIDHINGIPEIIEHYHVKCLYANDDFFERTDAWGTAKFLHDWVNQKGLNIERLRSNPDLNSCANLQILWPDRQTAGKETLSDNDRSLVFHNWYSTSNFPA
jgi:competence protein ComEC